MRTWYQVANILATRKNKISWQRTLKWEIHKLLEKFSVSFSYLYPLCKHLYSLFSVSIIFTFPTRADDFPWPRMTLLLPRKWRLGKWNIVITNVSRTMFQGASANLIQSKMVIPSNKHGRNGNILKLFCEISVLSH